MPLNAPSRNTPGLSIGLALKNQSRFPDLTYCKASTIVLANIIGIYKAII